MPKGEEIQVIAELTHLTVHAVRAVNGTIEAGGECMLDNKPGLEALLASVIPAQRPETFKVASVWPDDTRWHLSTDTEAFLDRTGDSLIKIAAASRGESKEPFAYAACNAGDGRSITSEGTVKWVLASSSRESMDHLAESLPGHRLSWSKATPSALARVGAITAALRGTTKGSVALWDLGATHSHLILITSGGIEGVSDCAIGIEDVFLAIQSALKLKFRGAGARLFINDGYDFTEAAPKISAAIAPDFKQAFALLSKLDPPPALSCIGLTGRQSWFVREMAATVGTTIWEPDLAKLTGNLGLKYADDAVAGAFSACSIGLLETLFSRIRGKDTWQPNWVEAEIPVDELEETAPSDPVPEFIPPTSAAFRSKPSLSSENATPPPPVVPRPPKPVPAPVIETMDEPAVEIPVPGAVASAVAAPAAPPAPGPDILQAPPPPDPSAASFPLPGSAPGAPPVRKPPPFKVGLAKPAVTSLPFEAAEAPILAPEDERELTKNRVGFYVTVAAVAAVVFAAIAFVVDSQLERIKQRDLAQQEILARHLTEIRLKEAERLSKEKEVKTRQETQTEIAEVQKKTEADTRKAVLAEVEAQKISEQPGGLSLATSPSGAAVSIDGKAPSPSPLFLTGVPAGPHHVRVTLASYEPVDLTVEVKGSKTVDLGTITLESALGTLAVGSSPDDLEFAVRTASDPSGAPLRTGRTPATLEGMQRGDYLVTYVRPGCRDHVEKASIRKGVKGAVDTKYVDGSLELTSDPSGAWVDKDGIRLGSTPLVLHDLTPKQAAFLLTLPGYDPTPISCDIPEGQTLKMNAQLLRRDRIFTPAEVKTMPTSYVSPAPELTASERKVDAEVTVSLIVQRDGTVVNVKVEKTTDDDIGRRCVYAVARWKYRPGTASDDRTVDVRLQVPFKFAAMP